MSIEIQAIPSLNDNYIWLLSNPDNKTAVCVDPGDADVVLASLAEQQLNLSAILITHHHWDHINGILPLLDHCSVPVFGPKAETIPGITHPLSDGDSIVLNELLLPLDIIATPGHTLGHICYYGQNNLFCGDTLFSAGCGRLFEGTAKQMYDSLTQLSQLPESTHVFCTHEYTTSNLRFALAVEPNNQTIADRLMQMEQLRLEDQITLPSTIAIEKQTNPFLRCHITDIQNAASHYRQQTLTDPVEVFAAIRAWKDNF